MRAKKYQLVKAQDQPWPGSWACSRKVKMPFIDQCSHSGQAFTLGQPSSISWQHVLQGEPVAAQSAPYNSNIMMGGVAHVPLWDLEAAKHLILNEACCQVVNKVDSGNQNVKPDPKPGLC